MNGETTPSQPNANIPPIAVKPKTPKLFWIVSVVLLVAISIGSYFFWLNRVNKVTKTVTTTANNSAGSAAKKKSSNLEMFDSWLKQGQSTDVPTKLSTETKTVSEPGFTFQYPADFDPLIKQTSIPNTSPEEMVGRYYRFYSQQYPSIFSIEIYDGSSITESIDPDWTIEQLSRVLHRDAANIFTKKISPKSLLIFYENPKEGEIAGKAAYVVAPLSKEFPNIIIELNNPFNFMSLTEQEAFGAVLNKAAEETNSYPLSSDFPEEAVKKIIDMQDEIIKNWIANGLPPKLQQQVDIAQGITDSVKPLP